MASVFNLEIYSTGGCFYKGACEHLVFESVDGSRGVMAGHEPVICALKRGEIRFLADGEWQKVAVTEGVCRNNARFCAPVCRHGGEG